MAFLLKLKKADLQVICGELGVEFSKDDTRLQLRKKIIESDAYEEGVIMKLANIIVTERLEEEKRELEKQKKLEAKTLEQEKMISNYTSCIRQEPTLFLNTLSQNSPAQEKPAHPLSSKT